MQKICACCGKQNATHAIEVTVKMHGLTYSTYVQARSCGQCAEAKIDQNEIAAIKVGIAKRLVSNGCLTGRKLAFCRKAIRVDPDELARHLNISTECLLSLEQSNSVVHEAIYRQISRRVNAVFRRLAFVPRFVLDEDTRKPAEASCD